MNSTITTTTIDCIHYGSSAYDPSKFKPICDRHWIKPDGGLWGSPVSSDHSWMSWCESEEFHMEQLKQSFQFTFKGSLFVINSEEDMNRLPWIEPGSMMGYCFVSFEALEACGFDGVHLTDKGERETRWTRPRNLYGWDCESVLVMNKDSIHLTSLKI